MRTDRNLITPGIALAAGLASPAVVGGRFSVVGDGHGAGKWGIIFGMDELQQGYRDLVVWQRAVDLAPRVYDLLKRLPPGDRYALGDQLRRAVVWVAANVAEGQARQHKKEFLQHLWIARGSLAETETLLVVGQRLGYWSDQDMHSSMEAIVQVRRPLQGLINRLRA